MNDPGPEFSFRGLPLSAEQESEIQHYIRQRRRRGLKPDLAELRGMLHDMLCPPMDEGMPEGNEAAGAHADAERATGLVDDAGDPVSVREERIAASESEAMKHQLP
ncbi:hypothetical protein ABT364_13205 [Massilia sp. SR12]